MLSRAVTWRAHSLPCRPVLSWTNMGACVSVAEKYFPNDTNETTLELSAVCQHHFDMLAQLQFTREEFVMLWLRFKSMSGRRAPAVSATVCRFDSATLAPCSCKTSRAPHHRAWWCRAQQQRWQGHIRVVSTTATAVIPATAPWHEPHAAKRRQLEVPRCSVSRVPAPCWCVPCRIIGWHQQHLTMGARTAGIAATRFSKRAFGVFDDDASGEIVRW